MTIAVFRAMAVLQALLALISKSAGKILNAIFGWAVHALFGKTSSKQQTVLSALVAAAVAWPLLLVGLAAPRVAAMVLAFAPIPHWVPTFVIRLVWLTLALVVPFALGLAITAHPPAGAPHEAGWKRLLRGFPITVGLAAAFIIMFVSVPIMRLGAIVRRRMSADIPLVTTAAAYHQVAALTIDVLNRHDFGLRPASPGWWVSAPTRILGWFGGDAFRRFVPERLEHYQSPALAISFYTSGVLLRGRAQKVTWAHGLIAELATRTDGLQASDPAAQRLEREIRRIWKIIDENPAAHTGSERLAKRVEDIARELGELDVDFDDWQLLYRQLLQLSRAVHGHPQLLESIRRHTDGRQDIPEEIPMASDDSPRSRSDVRSPASAGPTAAAAGSALAMPDNLAALSTVDLVKEITAQVGRLAEKQMELAKTELRADLVAEVGMVKGLAVAGLAALVAVNLLLVTGVLALARAMPSWSAGLAVTGVVLMVAALAGAIGWSKRVRRPLERTRRTLSDDAKWAKERIA